MLTIGCLVSQVLTIWFLLPFDSSIWLFGESSSHIWLFGKLNSPNLISSPPFDSFSWLHFSPLLILLIAFLPLLMIRWLFLYLLVLLYGCFSLPILVWFSLKWFFCLDDFSLWLVDDCCYTLYDDKSLWLLLSIGYAIS